MRTHLNHALANFEKAMRLVDGRERIPKADLANAEALIEIAQTQALISIAESMKNIEGKLDK